MINANAERIKNLTFNGKPIDPNAMFLVATNNYRAYGAICRDGRQPYRFCFTG